MDTSLLRRGALAIVLAAVGNALLLAAVLASGLVAPFQALSYPPVIFLSAVGAVGATLVYALVVRRSATPARIFTRIASAVLVLSFLPDIALLVIDPAATVGAVVALMLMHVVVAGAAVWALTRAPVGG